MRSMRKKKIRTRQKMKREKKKRNGRVEEDSKSIFKRVNWMNVPSHFKYVLLDPDISPDDILNLPHFKYVLLVLHI